MFQLKVPFSWESVVSRHLVLPTLNNVMNRTSVWLWLAMKVCPQILVQSSPMSSSFCQDIRPTGVISAHLCPGLVAIKCHSWLPPNDGLDTAVCLVPRDSALFQRARLNLVAMTDCGQLEVLLRMTSTQMSFGAVWLLTVCAETIGAVASLSGWLV